LKNILLTTLLTTLLASGSLGQDVSIGFSSIGDYGGAHLPVYSIDSLWQYGIPTKPEFDFSLASGPYQFCTDTMNYIQDTGRWEMYFGVSRDTLDFINNCLFVAGFECYAAKYNGVPDSTGLLIEVSPDNLHWYNLLDNDDEAAYIEHMGIACGFDNSSGIDTVGYLDGEPVWVNGDGWLDYFQFGLYHAWTVQAAGSVKQAHLRMTYISKTKTPHAGIAFVSPTMFFGVWCEGIGIGDMEGTFEPKLYPNPVTNSSILEIPQNVELPLDIMISDPTGRVIFNRKLYSRVFQLNKAQLGQGVYMYFLKGKKGDHAKGKFVVKI
jgi:hypothetical protein